MAKNVKSAQLGDIPHQVLMVKDLALLEVHPSCVEAHVAAGWKVAPVEMLRSEPPVAPVEPEEQPAE